VTPLSGKELGRLLERRGWRLARINGSHHIYTRPDDNIRLSVPVHGNKPLKVGLFSHLLKMAGIDPGNLD
jgi:predicted RNA binding protein YcfA (HicA-like mRNA interferase family)